MFSSDCKRTWLLQESFQNHALQKRGKIKGENEAMWERVAKRIFKMPLGGASEMSQWVKVLVVRPDDLWSIL